MGIQYEQDSTFMSIKEFVKKELSLRSSIGLSSETRLVEDLRVDGDDALELIEKFAERYQVDLSGFDSRQYFEEEGMHWLTVPALLLRLIIWPFRHYLFQQTASLSPLTLGMLTEIAQRKRWVV